jgi:glycosyltransferase involved in cell wall biosynthesis
MHNSVREIMKATCLINNFNYGQYVIEAINSVLKQSVQFDEIIVIDDCSTDQSAQILKDNFSDHDRIKLILKQKNEGQLAAMNDGFINSRGDLIFFLDADDVYGYHYLEEALGVYQNYPLCDFLSTAYTFFGDYAPPDLPLESSHPVTDCGYSAVNVFYRKTWIGAPTSMISARREILEKFMPVPYLSDWRTRADDCIIYGASIVGARKFQINQRLVHYRKHGRNDSAQTPNDPSYNYRMELRWNRLFSFLYKCAGYSENLDQLAHLEFRALPNPTFKDVLLYTNIMMYSSLSLNRRLKKIVDIWIRFFRSIAIISLV